MLRVEVESLIAKLTSNEWWQILLHWWWQKNPKVKWKIWFLSILSILFVVVDNNGVKCVYR